MATPTSIDQFLAQQRAGILEDFRDNGVMCLIATTHSRLAHHSRMYGGSLSYLSGVKPTSALVIQKPESEPELWVRANYRGYRRAFIKFLNQHYGLGISNIPTSLQVDHLQPSSYFPQDANHYFIRLALIERGINTSHGAGFERLLCERERERKLNGGIHMDWMAFLKIRGLYLPSKASGIEGWTGWAWQCSIALESKGFDAILAYVGLTTLLNLAFRNSYQPIPPHSSFSAELEAHTSYVCAPQLAEALAR